jgi:hypothetical protein
MELTPSRPDEFRPAGRPCAPSPAASNPACCSGVRLEPLRREDVVAKRRRPEGLPAERATYPTLLIRLDLAERGGWVGPAGRCLRLRTRLVVRGFESLLMKLLDLAERGGFEPPSGGYPLPVFKTGAFNRSATSPEPQLSPAGWPQSNPGRLARVRRALATDSIA